MSCKGIAAPMVGGMISSTVLTLAVIPAISALVKGVQLRRILNGLRPIGTVPAAQAPTGVVAAN